ncbi:P-loop NTPase fold protein [Saccharopolyspora spinosa]|uniref:P-loop NTPase fold protein n=1 Tax=Saccharopolyspora spinosa TaxID=60894 RepID=UPI0013053CF3|nr:P-loop NTPase fold protein [Saccharopolyspora spinosa]
MLNFDRNIVRRAYTRLAKRRRVVGVVRLLSKVVLKFFGVHRLVDDLGRQLSVDAKSRNEIRDVVHGIAKDWKANSATDGYQLVVFIDDLDRCFGDVVLAVREAIKLCLDVPGLVFVSIRNRQRAQTPGDSLHRIPRCGSTMIGSDRLRWDQ